MTGISWKTLHFHQSKHLGRPSSANERLRLANQKTVDDMPVEVYSTYIIRSDQIRQYHFCVIQWDGLFCPQVSHVINFDCPQFMSDYIHRVGRVGRVGMKQTDMKVTTLVSQKWEVDLVWKIEVRLLSSCVDRHWIFDRFICLWLVLGVFKKFSLLAWRSKARGLKLCTYTFGYVHSCYTRVHFSMIYPWPSNDLGR